MLFIAASAKDSISPKPMNLLTKLFGLNLSKSYNLSPVPMKHTGTFKVATADNAPPEVTLPSTFVRIILCKFTAFLNASAYILTPLPVDASITNILWCGWTAESNYFISYINSSDYLCLPDVSINIKFILFFLKNSIPFYAIYTEFLQSFSP